MQSYEWQMVRMTTVKMTKMIVREKKNWSKILNPINPVIQRTNMTQTFTVSKEMKKKNQ